MKTFIFFCACVAACLLPFSNRANAQSTAFNYQGRLKTGSAVANGSYDLQFTLYSADSSGSAIVDPQNPQTVLGVSVVNGLFTVKLDFGASFFTGSDRWLEIGARTTVPGGSFSIISPRQPILPVPYAITATTAANLSGSLPASQLTGNFPATQLSGVLPSAQLSGTYSGAVTFDNANNNFSGHGNALTDIELSGLNSQGGLTLANSSTYFLLSSKIPVSDNPYTAAVADVNGDGKPDLISGNGDKTLTVLINNGDGTFTPTSDSPINLAFSPIFIIAVDLNGSAGPDLIIAGDNNALNIMLNNGHGVFTPAAEIHLATTPYAVAAADLNGDGIPDLISANYFAGSLSVLIGAGDGTFNEAPGSPYTVSGPTPGGGTGSIAVADINGDGIPDLIAAEQYQNSLTILTGNSAGTTPDHGDGTFTIAATPGVGQQPFWAIAADINGDGKPDLISANQFDNTLTILINNRGAAQTVAFNAPTTVSVGTSPYFVIAADVDGVHGLDLISANPGNNTLTVMTNDGVGTFGLASTIAAGGHPTTVVAADVNGDGRIDLINPSSGSSALAVLTNAFGILTTHFSGDGSGLVNLRASAFPPNVAFLDQDQQVFTGANAFLNPDNVFFGTFIGDGSQLISLNARSLTGNIKDKRLSGNVPLLNGDDQHFSGRNIFDDVDNIFVGTFFGSGYNLTDLDARKLVNGPIDDSLLSPNVALLNGNAAFYGTVTAGAFSGSGAGLTGVDLRNVSAAGAINWTTNFESFTLSEETSGVGSGPSSIAIADVNGDGRPDLISANAGADTLSILLADNCGGFESGFTVPVGLDPSSVVAADVNGDNKIDLIVANYGDNNVTVLLGDGFGSFAPAAGSPFPVGLNPSSVVAIDINGDNKIDLITANQGNNSVTVLLGDGLGGFTAVAGSPFSVGSNPSSVVAADVNADGKIDLITANQGGDNLTVLLGDGLGGFSEAVDSPYTVGSQPSSVTVADVNGDGYLDLVSANKGNHTLTLLLNDGAGSFGAPNSINVGSGPVSVIAAYLNADALIDLIVANETDSTLTILLNDGFGGFSTQTQNLGAGRGPASLAAADVDRNGTLDLVTANADAPSLSLILTPVTTYQASFAGDGGGLTGLIPGYLNPGIANIDISGNAATATTADTVTGSISDSHLSGNIPRLDSENTFTAVNHFTGGITGNGSGLTALNGANLAPSSVTPDKLVPTYGYFYLLSAGLPTIVSSHGNVSFPTVGLVSDGIIQTSPTVFTLSAIGVYEVTWQVTIVESGQLVLVLGGVSQGQTVVGRDTGNTQIMGNVLIETVSLNTTLNVQNPTGNSLTIPANSAGSLVIKRIK